MKRTNEIKKYNSVKLCETSVASVVKKELTTENHKEGTENTKRET
jgi:hypothetical protein